MDFNKEQLFDLLPEYIKEKKIKEIRDIFEEYNIVDLAEIVESLSINNLIFTFRILPKDISGQLFSYLNYNTQEELLKILSSHDVNKILDNMFSDDIVDFIEEMPANVIKKILSSVSSEQRNEINSLLSYKDYTAGSIMSTDFLELQDEQTVADAITKIKKEAENVETINICYVINKYRTYLGVVHLRDIIISKNNTKIRDLIEETDIFVNTSTDQEEVANKLKEYDLTSIPVLNDEHRLIGIITADDVIDVLVEEGTEDIHKMSGISYVDGSYIQASNYDIIKSRITWLLILMISASFTGQILQTFEDKLNAVPILAISIPVIMSTAGNAGSQSSTTIIRSIAVDGIRLSNILSVLKKEFLVSLICGSIIFIVNFLRLIIFNSLNNSFNLLIPFVVSLTLFISLAVSNLVGSFLPLLAKSMNLDPASMAAPIITTIVDATSLITYFWLAIYFLKL